MCATQLVTSKMEKITMKKNKGLDGNIILEYTNMIMVKSEPRKGPRRHLPTCPQRHQYFECIIPTSIPTSHSQ